MNRQVVLASNSPRRRELLKQIGLTFSIDPADVDERVLPGENPKEYTVRVALDKARAAAARANGALVIAADTIVVLDSVILGKPEGTADAERMLSLLSGRDHLVITGIAVLDSASGRTLADAATTRVWFRQLDSEEIKAYVATGEPLDKAGAYGIQDKGALLVSRIDGCYFNVVGLPLALLAQKLPLVGINLLTGA